MASTKFRMLILVSAVLTAVAAPVGAVPIFTFADFYTVRFASNPLSSISDGDFVQIAVTISGASTPDPISSLSVEATQGSSTVLLNYFPLTASLFDPLYQASFPFAQAVTGIGWSITATDSTGTSAPVFTPRIAFPLLLPFVTDVTVSDTSTTPTVTWTLPDLTGLSVDRIHIRIIDASTEVQLFQAQLPTAAATSFLVPGGTLAFGESYIYRVILVDDRLGTTENQSNAFSRVVTTVPEPATLTLMLAGLASIGGARRLTRAGRSPESGLLLVGSAVRRRD